MNKTNIAKIIRAITVPPVLIAILLTVLYVGPYHVFTSSIQYCMGIITLTIIPVLAYPLQKIIPQLKHMGREGQRKLAFLLSLIGYLCGILFAHLTNANNNLKFIFYTYFLSVVLLVIYNKCIHIKASGHACSVTGPLLFFIYFVGWKSIFPCIILACLIVWASLFLKRHTKGQLLLGSLCCLIAFLITNLVLNIL